MVKPALPPDEAARLEALRRYEILDTLPEAAYDDIARLASYICETPISMVTLVDQNRQWFKAKVGIEEAETSRDISFCAHAILQRDLFVVSDTRSDPRFANNPLVVNSPSIRFYAGAPLVTSRGYALGTLCVLDREPRHLSEAQADALQTLSRQVIGQLELRRTVTAQALVIRNLRRAEEALRQAGQEYRNIYENALEGLYETTAQGPSPADNQVLARVYGYDSPEEFLANLTDI